MVLLVLRSGTSRYVGMMYYQPNQQHLSQIPTYLSDTHLIPSSFSFSHRPKEIEGNGIQIENINLPEI